MGLPTLLPHGRDEELSWYRKIDEGPWDGLATSEGISFSGSWALTVQLAAAAAMTQRVRLWTCIAALPLRNTVLFAKELATIDVLSGGRLTLGVGIGALDEDYLALGSELSERRQRMDQQVATMRRVWAQEPPVAGAYPVGPKPVQVGGIPIVAGVAGPKSLARAAKWATGVNDGSNTVEFNAQALLAHRERVAHAWIDAGRTEQPHFSASIYFALGANAKSQFAEYIGQVARSYPAEYVRQTLRTASNFGVDGLRNAVKGAKDAGLDGLVIMPTTSDPSEIDRARDVLGI